MLTAETKRHIDAARQVLVGVVPNPSSQIDQITNALIYKFMDDMDQSAIKAGGEASFFVKDLERYSWTRLMDSRIGNQDRMNIYSEALVRFSEAKQLPELFRNIFKSAFLPYRSPEVLGLFLKEIAYFDYSHSEELGNAYEYLLSIMGSQGDAGQFRTPRHIIDFIVEVVKPTKDDKVLDPACGTGGFLISAYKHILAQHDGKNPDGSKNNEKPLTPDQRKALVANFEGYDVDPSMVRIAQVNMYLHKFKNPKIFNYNSLADEERWGDKFDVILANPPFMSPKGGVSTHNKFSVESTRSEVLFVDYIMNHLRPKGRAGIIVPEGIIFQSGTTYKQLRKNLVEDGLYAVVSLPSGVFQPYSGVKTSILLFNNEQAKQKSELLFLKIENDGFDLGAQRRPISKNDFPQALDVLNKWSEGKKVESNIATYVEKSKIAETGGYNLSGDRYRTATDYSNAKWKMVKLEDLCSFEYGDPMPEKNRKPGPYPVLGSNGIVGYHDSFSVEGPAIVVGRKGSAGEVTWVEQNCFPIDTTYYVKIKNQNIGKRYLYYILTCLELTKLRGGGAVPGLNRNDAYGLQIPLPSLEVQEQIVAELDGYQNIINGAHQVVENWNPQIDIDPAWKKTNLGEVCDFVRGPFGGSLKKEIFVADGYAVYEQSHAIYEDFSHFRYFVDEKKYNEMKRFEVQANDLIMSCSGTMGKTAIIPSSPKKGIINQALLKLTPHKKLDVHFLKLWMDSGIFQNQLLSNVAGAAIQNVASVKVLQGTNIALPPLEIQKQIVENIEAERTLVEANKKLIVIYEQKTKDTLAKLWSE